MTIKRLDSGEVSFDFADAKEVLGREVSLVNNFDGEPLDSMGGGLWLEADGSLTVYLNVPHLTAAPDACPESPVLS
ncbi:hypothetical protein ACG83_10190 [Frankia sp. R43]|uniref:hypothetical protein n=1 Tax=Frankia sp. R43 TaxID=269536 RepID=UPI0006C9E90C|nr:hypothetical protein [Frankia sp. R43]KPM55651.1 hypothetical protein ACG83_10190 [Frankia sp. R43]